MASGVDRATAGDEGDGDDRHPPMPVVGASLPRAPDADDRITRRGPLRYGEALDNARQGVWEWDLATDLITCTPLCLDLLGLLGDADRRDPRQPPHVPLRDCMERLAPEDLPSFQAAVRSHLSGSRPFIDQEIRILRAPGEVVWGHFRAAAILNENGLPIRVSGTLTDITERRKLDSRCGDDALHDPMTGLPNRGLLLDRVSHSLDRTRRLPGKHIAVAVIDLDRFKKVTDALGGRLADEVLKIVAQRLEATRRQGDTLARISTDEFCVILNDISDIDQAVAACARMGAAVAEPLSVEGHQLVLSGSIGVTTSASGYDHAEDMLRDCGLAVYRAKRQGRGRIDVYDRSLRRQAITNMRTETDLRAALDNGELELFYQPIVALRDRRIAGLEALMRWRHPTRGLVSPGEFIPLAEETGLIVPIGRWALKRATRQLSEWRRRLPHAHSLFMSVNVSFRQFSHDDLPARVREALDEAALGPEHLKLEITESLLMHDPEHSREVMCTLREMGVGLSIDDFGTGYSSLSYLNKLPARSLKIDRSFVESISGGENSAAIVQVVTTLAAILGMEAIAEGVERPDEAAFLRDIMCKYAQGYLFARPLPAGEVEAMLKAEAEGDRLFDHLFPLD